MEERKSVSKDGYLVLMDLLCSPTEKETKKNVKNQSVFTGSLNTKLCGIQILNSDYHGNIVIGQAGPTYVCLFLKVMIL